MSKFVKGFVCAEMTADGPRQFAVESKAVFDVYVGLSEMGSNEAEHWGGFEFDLDPDDEDTYDADGDQLDKDELAKCQVITMDEINKARAAHIDVKADDVEDSDDEDEYDEYDEDEYDEDEYDNEYEYAFLAVRDGDFRE